jgi:autotransporter-associated beta strand protein
MCLVPLANAQRQMEQLGRGVVAVRSSSTQAYVGWRLLGNDSGNVGFNLYRVTSGATNKLNGALLTNTTDFVDTTANLALANGYFVVPVVGNVTQAASGSFTLLAGSPVQQYLNVPLQRPAGNAQPSSANTVGHTNSYSPNDCSVGDLDGDGEYEIVVKWDPSDSQDNSNDGHTGPVYLDAYELDGTQLWRINLGKNIRAGAHYTQFVVYDLDGDGRAEVACKTAPGTVDGQTNNVILSGDDPNIIYTNSNGYIITGPEYLTIFDGLTGSELFTTNFYPDRVSISQWGDSYGNRGDRFLSAIAYLDGQRPSLIIARGYYGPQSGFSARNEITAWNWRNGQLSRQWWFKAGLGINNDTNVNYIGQGNHNLSIADVDGDGKDEIVYGACTIDDNGMGLYSTGFGHGDALHVSDMDPDRPGLEVWTIHEPSGVPGADMHDAGTGAVIHQTATVPSGQEGPGRGVAGDVWANNRGYEMWGGGGFLDRYGNNLGSVPGSVNFLVWWDTDLVRELEDGISVTKYGGGTLLNAAGALSNNGTKSTPALSADILGDWREEIIWRTSDNLNLRIYTTTNAAANRICTLMHDPQYREAIAWQNVAYNQPPHPGFFLGAGMYPPPVPPMSEANLVWRGGVSSTWDTSTANWFTNRSWMSNFSATTFSSGNSVLFDISGSNSVPITINGALAPAKVTVHAPGDYAFVGPGSLTGTMSLVKAGAGILSIYNTNSYTGPTALTEGVLFIQGTLSQSPLTAHGSVWGSQLLGSGRLGGGASLSAGTTLIPGLGIGVPGTITISNQLTEVNEVVNLFDLSSDPTGTLGINDRVNVVGNVTLSGTNIIEVNMLDGFLNDGVYPLFTYSGTLNGGLSNLVLTGPFQQHVALTNPPGMIGLFAVLPDDPPGAPSDLVAAAIGPFQIELEWIDNSADEYLFLLERSTDNVNFVQIAQLSEDTTNYSDSGLTPGGTYYYRVYGTNLMGASDYSNVASNTTPPTLPPLTWRGDGTANVWDDGGAANWFDGSSLTIFGDGTPVIFDQTGSNTPSINLVGLLQPLSVTVNATKSYTNTGSGSLAGPMTLAKSGTGTLTINTTNLFSGGMVISNGVVALGSIAANMRGLGIGPITFMGGTLQFNGYGSSDTGTDWGGCTNPFVVPAGQTGQLRMPPRFGWGSPFTSSLTGSGTLNIVDDYVRCGFAGNWSAFAGQINVGPRSGTCELRINNAFGYANAALYLSNGVTLYNINGSGQTIDIGELAGASGATLGPGNGSSSNPTWRVGAKNTDATFAGIIVNAGTTSLIKTGNGMWTLAGANTYTGTTVVNGGTLVVNGNQSAATGSITVNTSGALGGNGTNGGAATINGTLSPGVSIGRLTFTNTVTFGGGGKAFIEISKTPKTNDLVRVLGALTYNGTLIVTNLSGTLASGDSFKIFDAPTYNNGFSAFSLPALGGGLGWNTSTLASDGTISVIAVTVPSITGITVGSSGIVITATGATNGTFYVLSSTNVLLPGSNWTRISTNTFNASGNAIVTNAINPSVRQTFYRLQLP